MRRPLLAASFGGSFTGHIWHRDQPILGSRRDRYMLEWLRAQADVLLYGAGTVRVDRRRIRFTFPDLRSQYAERGGGSVPPLAVVATRADFDWEDPFWTTPTDMTLFLPGEARTEEIPGHVQVITDVPDLPGVLDRLGALGHSRVLYEGGGRLYASLCRLDLVDELFYTVTPWLMGSDAAPVTAGPLSPQRYTLVSATTADQEVFLRYRTPSGRVWTTCAVPG
ncbi:dihydrofolate reductase family protein [Nonomuraea sp. NPDC059023]|uniref:dihydrofolate reductase family protein n=1 Tax=unclassified Nonomuraea TaxID=2593643 RepID=UPI0036913058